ncbi:HAD family hydrolase [Ornithinimicrobium cerasi]|uniref:HAD-superfamily hydrolase, subfamily IIB n=1 Tax=Ornithinimicrobium cerasi TaxID=2248773 RepID=A0A285VU18_9MICO|nr:HAD family hydrolase [Ornithinimicrobium cerasi]SOC57453.1 HAD-superfamily hydrolase, subfamily IIB [Ornithinimicrobium cerasi]
MSRTERPDVGRHPLRDTRLLVSLDVDGTLLRHDGHLSPRVARTVRTLDALPHVTVVIATGRSVQSTLPVMEHLGLMTPGRPVVCSNGAVTVSVDPGAAGGYRLDDVVTFDPAPAVAVVRRELPDVLVAVEEVGVGFKVSTPFPPGELWGEEIIVPFEELVADPVTRVTFRDPNSTSEEFSEMVERIGLHGVSYAVGYSAWLDLAPEGVSKASALEQVRRRLGVEPHRTVAAGDQRNDLEMLDWAARSYAMGQAPPEVIAMADRVTGAVTEDGLVDALQEVLDELA